MKTSPFLSSYLQFDFYKINVKLLTGHFCKYKTFSWLLCILTLHFGNQIGCAFKVLMLRLMLYIGMVKLCLSFIFTNSFGLVWSQPNRRLIVLKICSLLYSYLFLYFIGNRNMLRSFRTANAIYVTVLIGGKEDLCIDTRATFALDCLNCKSNAFTWDVLCKSIIISNYISCLNFIF